MDASWLSDYFMLASPNPGEGQTWAGPAEGPNSDLPTSPTQEHLLMSADILGFPSEQGGCCWHLVNRSQGCCKTQKCIAQQRITQLKMSIVPQLGNPRLRESFKGNHAQEDSVLPWLGLENITLPMLEKSYQPVSEQRPFRKVYINQEVHLLSISSHQLQCPQGSQGGRGAGQRASLKPWAIASSWRPNLPTELPVPDSPDYCNHLVPLISSFIFTPYKHLVQVNQVLPSVSFTFIMFVTKRRVRKKFIQTINRVPRSSPKRLCLKEGINLPGCKSAASAKWVTQLPLASLQEVGCDPYW